MGETPENFYVVQRIHSKLEDLAREVTSRFYITGGMSHKAVMEKSIEVCYDTNTDPLYNHVFDNLGGGTVYNIIVASLIGPKEACMGLL